MKNKTTQARAIQSLAILLLLVMSFMPYGGTKAEANGESAYDVAVVDGDYSEWDLSADFYADMFRAADSKSNLESKLYIRFDCYTETLYALVLAQPGVYILTDGDSFIKWGNSTKIVDDSDAPPDGTLPEFAWINKVYSDSLGQWVADGWEASAYVAVGDYSNLNVHTQVYDGGSQTSAVAGRSIPISMVCYDYGDLPEDPSTPAYNMTTNANNGARHIPGNIFLGASIDMEHDGLPNQLATGDDNSGDDDEDGGVRIANPPAYWSQGQGAVNVMVTNSGNGITGDGGVACLSAWMDFWDHYNGYVGTDGDFTDTGAGWSENVINNMSLAPGTTLITFTLPLDAATYPVYARFRLAADADGDGDCSDQPAPQLTGLMQNGEVEDYVFNFNSTAVTLQTFKAYPIKAGTAVGLPAILGIGVLGLFWRSRRSQ